MAALTLVALRFFLQREWKRITAFLVIGFSSLVSVIGLYKLLSLVVWKHGPPTLQYTLIVVPISWLNYEANRYFTFEKNSRSMSSMWRFTMVAIFATALNSALFWFGHEALQIPDTIVIIFNSALIAFFTFTSHRLFTFHERPWRFFERFTS